MRRLLVVLLALVMIPVFMGALCPCAMAAPVDQPAFQKMKCHGCCPGMAASFECRGGIYDAQKPGAINRAPTFFSNVLKALHPGASQDIAINRRALVPAGDEPSSFFQPLSLSLLVLRI